MKRFFPAAEKAADEDLVDARPVGSVDVRLSRRCQPVARGILEGAAFAIVENLVSRGQPNL